VIRLIIAIVIGAAIASGGAFALTASLGPVANGTPTPTQSSLYVYGGR
jgi:hypothetical protein